MKIRKDGWKTTLILIAALIWLCGAAAAAEGLSNDNSLADLGILTEGAQVSPEFTYGVTEYDVTVPEGTQSIDLDPVPSNGNAHIADISGRDLVDGAATVEIVVEAENGEQFPYYLHVTADSSAGTVAPPEPETQPQPQTEAETEPQTEDPRYVKVDRNSLEEAEHTIAALKEETTSYRDRVSLLMKIIYGMIAFCVILLFIVINLMLKKRDLKAELQDVVGYGYPQDGENAGYDGQSYAEAGYDGQGYAEAGYDGQGYAETGYGGQGHAEAASADGRNQAEQKPAGNPRPRRVRDDDPSTVPHPPKTKKRPQPQPEYQPPRKESSYQPPKQKNDSVEVTMIDL